MHESTGFFLNFLMIGRVIMPLNMAFPLPNGDLLYSA